MFIILIFLLLHDSGILFLSCLLYYQGNVFKSCGGKKLFRLCFKYLYMMLLETLYLLVSKGVYFLE